MGQIKWTELGVYFPGKHPNSCRSMFKKLYAPNVKKGKWTEEEDIKIAVGVALFGPRWNEIAKNIFNGPNEEERRTDVQCRERWMCSLNPDAPIQYTLNDHEKVILGELYDKSTNEADLSLDEATKLKD